MCESQITTPVRFIASYCLPVVVKVKLIMPPSLPSFIYVSTVFQFSVKLRCTGLGFSSIVHLLTLPLVTAHLLQQRGSSLFILALLVPPPLSPLLSAPQRILSYSNTIHLITSPLITVPVRAAGECIESPPPLLSLSVSSDFLVSGRLKDAPLRLLRARFDCFGRICKMV